jgi:hypothetical protein
MNEMPWENVICEAKIEETTQSGAKVTMKCDGVMLPIRKADGALNGVPVEWLIWKCHKCGRAVE